MERKMILNYLMYQIDRNNYGLLSTFKPDNQALKYIRDNNIQIKGNKVIKDGEPIYNIIRKYASKKINGMYKELSPELVSI